MTCLPAQLFTGMAGIAGSEIKDAATRSHQLAKARTETFSQQALKPTCMPTRLLIHKAIAGLLDIDWKSWDQAAVGLSIPVLMR